MKSFVVGTLIAQLIGLAPQARSQNATPVEKLHLQIGAANVEANSIERGVHYPSIIQLRGNVQITMKIGVGDAPPKFMIMVLRADEVSFHEGTGEIEARGNVQMNYRDDPSGIKAGNVHVRLEKIVSK